MAQLGQVVAHDWEGLQGSIAGEIILQNSPDYESARRPAIARFHQSIQSDVPLD